MNSPLIILLLASYCHGGEVQQATREDDYQCPPWFVYNPVTEQCECFNSPSTDNIVRCTRDRALVRLGYCMTYQIGEGVFLSPCNYRKAADHNITENRYIVLPENKTKLNEYMCAPLNGKGLACSECINNFGRPIVSREIRCSNCANAWYGVPLYLFMEFVPITVFYFIILFFQISMTSAPMLAYIFYCQVSVSTLLRLQYNSFESSYSTNFLSVLITFYGFWNLDFFRYILPPFCVSSKIQPIHIVTFLYVSAFYPLCLIGITWLFIKLYTRDVRPITWIWKNVNQHLLKSIKKKFEAKNALIDVFATFFLLSYAKFVYTGFTLLSYGITFNLNNGTLALSVHVESDSSISFFSREHVPFVIISITIFLVAVIPLTLLLALYPIHCVRALLFIICRLSNHTIASLNIFVEKFYSCYRDGLDGGKDMRSLASLYFFLRLIVNFIFIDQIPLSASYTFVALLYAGCSLFIAIVQPYKKAFMNTIDSLILANMALITILLDKYSFQDNANIFGTVYLFIGSILATLPMLGMTGFISYKIIKKLMKRMPSYIKNKPCCLRLKKNDDIEARQERNSESNDDLELPDRILHPEEYEEEQATTSIRE